MFLCDKNSTQDKIKTFATFGDTGGGGITRLALSRECIAARREFVKRMKAIGAVIEMDDLANVYATIPGSDPAAKRIAMGSHCDSVVKGGNYDGILGVLGAMEVLETIVAQKIPHKHPITAMIWTNEEGALYPPALMVSGVVCGKFDKDAALASTDADGRTFAQALDASGFAGTQDNRFSAKNYAANFELHIEQGPILEAQGKDIGVVPCVLGMVNYRIKAHGQRNHAGTTPMSFRKDSLFAAAQAICYLHEKLDRLDPALVYTTGEIVCRPCIHTVIPEYVDFSLDSRHEDPEVIAQVVEAIGSIPDVIAGCKIETQKMWARDTVCFDAGLVESVQKSVDALGYSNMRVNSGAGHDAQYTAGIVPTTMIFVPSKDGRSHCEEEYTSPEQCWQGMNVLLNAVLDADAKL